MRLITNKQIVDWFLKYGLNVVIALISLLIVCCTISSILNSINKLTAPTCNIEDLNNSTTLVYKDKYFETEKFDHREYDYSGDYISILLQEVN